jgi:TrmH family RNA methyltransferase
MKKMSSMESPSNVLAVCEKSNSKEIIGNKILLLDNIQDPGNLGTIIRSSVAFDIDTIILSKNSVDLYNPKVLRSTQGMIFHKNIIVKDINKYIRELKENNYYIYGTKVNGGNDIKKVILPLKYAIVVGNEGKGISEAILNLCDEYLYIKMNNKCESLNVSVATSILLY